jgi:hypothetical protein
MEQELASLKRATSIANVVYGASLTRSRKQKTTTPLKQSHNPKPKTQSSLYTFVKKQNPKHTPTGNSSPPASM